MVHVQKDFNHLLGKMKGISDKQMTAHFGLYGGYVKKLNEIEDKLKTADPATANYSYGDFSELKRRETVAFNGTYLHQYYFENLTGDKTEASKDFKKAVDTSFGSWDKFITDMKGCAASTPGWVLITKNQIDGKLHSYVTYEHMNHTPVFQKIVLALDCWEHAFMIDYGTNKADYVKAFLENVDWNVVSKRYDKA